MQGGTPGKAIVRGRRVDLDVPSTLGVEGWDISVVEESVNRVPKQNREEVAWFLNGGVVVIPTDEGRVSYMSEQAFEQF